MDKTGEGNEQTKKCFCARCFLPIDPEDKVDIDGQNFHKFCSMCCICRTIPTSLKMFYGHVFCNECFKTHVLNKFRGEPPRMHSNSWWMRWAPGAKPQESQPDAKIGGDEKENEPSEEEKSAPPKSEEPCKKCICARCLQAVDEAVKVDIGGQSFHPQCARCYFCHTIPTDKVKIYYGQVFCEDCFHRYVMARGKDTPAEHFRACFDQWQNNPQARNKCDKIVSAASPRSLSSGSMCTWDLSFEGRTDPSDLPHSNCSRESANQENVLVAAAEKIEKLTKYLQDNSDSEKCSKKWKNFVVEYENDKGCVATGADRCAGWVDLQSHKIVNDEVNCPKCLWQCGPIIVNGEIFRKEVVCCGDGLLFE